MTKIIERIAPPNVPTIEVFGKKIIEITNCTECPYSSECGRYCSMLHSFISLDTTPISKRCPLPDKEK
jgi:hypothetical protein